MERYNYIYSIKRLQRREFLETEKIDKRTHYNVLVKEKQYQRFETREFIKIYIKFN